MFSPCQETLFFEADQYFKNILWEIRRAKFSVKIESYIFENDYLGKMIIDELEMAVKRGVRCYLMIDGIGSSKIHSSLINDWNNIGIETRVYNPLPWQINWSMAKFIGQLLRFINSILSINKRNHRKLIIVDNRIAYVGSFNISDVHLKFVKGESAWRDCGIKITGRSVDTLNRAFRHAWNLPFNPHMLGLSTVYAPIKKQKDNLVRLNYSLKWRTYFQRDLLKKVQRSQKRIWITNPYFVPDISIVNQLKLARKRGVDVRVLIPKKSDLKLFPYINSLFYRGLLRSGIRVYEYLPRVLHAKTMIIDDWMILGSSNLNSRSHKHDLEVDMVIDSLEQKDVFEHQFRYLLNQSEELAYQDVLERYRYDYLRSSLIYFVKYWL